MGVKRAVPKKLSDDECVCGCHDGYVVKHVAPCCVVCNYCMRHIAARVDIDEHAARCQRKPVNQLH